MDVKFGSLIRARLEFRVGEISRELLEGFLQNHRVDAPMIRRENLNQLAGRSFYDW